MLTAEAERVLAYFRQEYWPNQQRSANAVHLHRRVVGAAAGITELLDKGMLTLSMDQSSCRLTEKGVEALGLLRSRPR